MDQRDKNYILGLLASDLERLDKKYDRLLDEYTDIMDNFSEQQAQKSIEYCVDHIVYVFSLFFKLLERPLEENEYCRHGTPEAGGLPWGVYKRCFRMYEKHKIKAGDLVDACGVVCRVKSIEEYDGDLDYLLEPINPNDSDLIEQTNGCKWFRSKDIKKI